MPESKQIPIYWKGELVGYIEDPSPDMWYVEGRWQTVDSEIAVEFLQLTSHQSWADFHNLQSAEDFIWVGLGENIPHYVFVTFVNQSICLRLVTSISPPNDR